MLLTVQLEVTATAGSTATQLALCPACRGKTVLNMKKCKFCALSQLRWLSILKAHRVSGRLRLKEDLDDAPESHGGQSGPPLW